MIDDPCNPPDKVLPAIGQEIFGFTEFEGGVFCPGKGIFLIQVHGWAPEFIALVQGIGIVNKLPEVFPCGDLFD
jgi:hypothetical protein